MPTKVSVEKFTSGTRERSSVCSLFAVLWKTPTVAPFHSQRKPPAFVPGKDRAV